jgi:hypothetical protein
LKSSLRISERGVALLWFKVELESLLDAISAVTEATSVVWKLLDHWLSYKTMTMLWRFGNFPVDLNL